MFWLGLILGLIVGALGVLVALLVLAAFLLRGIDLFPA